MIRETCLFCRKAGTILPRMYFIVFSFLKKKKGKKEIK